jgi:hypothetical protein
MHDQYKVSFHSQPEVDLKFSFSKKESKIIKLFTDHHTDTKDLWLFLAPYPSMDLSIHLLIHKPIHVNAVAGNISMPAK